MRVLLALVPALCLLSCSGSAKRELVEHIRLLEEECRNLGRITDEVDALEGTVWDLRRAIRRDLDALGAIEGCGPCADELRTRAAPALAERPIAPMPIKPLFVAPASTRDRTSELQDRLLALKMARDELRARASERDKLESEVEILLGARTALGGPTCGHSDCRARLESRSR